MTNGNSDEINPEAETALMEKHARLPEELRTKNRPKAKATPEFSAEKIDKIRRGVKFAEKMAWALDKGYLDPIIGLIEGVGDVVSAIPTLYYLYIGHKMGMSRGELIQIFMNGAKDLGLGTIPAIGDVADFFYKKNLANAKILRERFDEIEREATMQFQAEQPLVAANIEARTGDTHRKATGHRWPWSKKS